MKFLFNNTIFNETQLSILMTPEYFMNLYAHIYLFDKNILKLRDVAFVLSTIFMVTGIVGNLISIYVFQKKKTSRK